MKDQYQIRVKIFWFFQLLTGLLICLFSCERSQHSIGSSGDINIHSDTSKIYAILQQVAQHEFKNPDTNYKYLDSAYELTKKYHYVEGQAKTMFLYGNSLYSENKYKEALGYYSTACDLAKDLESPLLKAQCLERMASVNLTLGDDHLALKLYYEALPLFEQASNKEGIAKVFNIIGLYKSAQKAYDSSEMYFRRAIRLNEEINNRSGIVHNKGNLGYLYEKIGEYEKAGEIYSGLVHVLIEMGDSVNLPVIYYNISSLFEKQNLLDSTLRYIRLSMRITEKKKDTSLLSALYGNYGDIMRQINYLDSAYFFLEKSAMCAHAIGDPRNGLDAQLLLFGLDTLSNKYERALSRFGQIMTLSDTINRRKIRNNLKTSELRYENQKKDNRIELQKIHLDKSKKQKRTFLYLFLFSLLSGILFLVIVVLILKNKKKRQILHDKQILIKDLEIENTAKSQLIDKMHIQQIEEEMKVKEREQISHALALEQKNELLGMINSKIVEAMKDTGIIKISELNGIVASIKAQLVDSVESDLFNQKFSQLHKEFYNEIKQAHPDLTKSELKFCAYLKINLSGSQIAKIQNVTSEAIRKTRYRIRKKLKLSPEESLEYYISTF